MQNNLPSFLSKPEPCDDSKYGYQRPKVSFIDRTLRSSANAIKSIYLQAENAAKGNFIYKINPHIKLISLLFMVVVVSISHNLTAQSLITSFIFLMFLLARINVFHIYKKIFFLAFIFGFVVVAPASLNVITPGEIIFNIFSFDEPNTFWIYHIPQNIGFTEAGIQVVMLVFMRVFNSISFSLLIVFTTSFPGFVKSFKMLGVPDTLVMIIMLAYKYIFMLSKTIEDAYFALKSRLITNIKDDNIRKLVGQRIFFIFKKSRSNYENTYYAMVSRGYNGKIYLRSHNRLQVTDVISLVIVVAFGICILFI